MKRRFAILAGTVLLFAAVLSLALRYEHQEQAIAEESPSGSNRIGWPLYGRLVIAAWLGDCEAAYKLGRHHLFFSLNTNEAIRWYRLAVKCPHAAAKGELIMVLMHFEAEDAEVDRLLAEIAKLDPKAAAYDRASVESVRRARQSPSQ